jgi:hypothetical protein
MGRGMNGHNTDVDLDMPFTLYEVCPSCKGTGMTPPNNMGWKDGNCPRCHGRKVRGLPFPSLAALPRIAADLPEWPKPAK